MARKSLVIVGGGYAGCDLASALQSDLDVTLVEPREAFVHAPAMIRALVDPALLDHALIPYDKFLTQGRVLRDRAALVSDVGVTLEGGDTLSTDYIVVATGSSNGGVFKPEGSDIAAFRRAQAALNKEIMAARSLVIVGAGAVGTELAGEIAHAMPAKSVTLVSAEPALFPTLPRKLGASLEAKLKDMGVTLVLGTRATDLQSTTEASSGALSLSNGQKLEADLIIPAIGARPQTDLLKDLPGTRVLPGGRIAANGFLRPSTLPNLFALGDAIDSGDAATIVAISRQQPWLAKTLKAVSGGKALESQKKYTPWKRAPMLVPLGPQRGASFLMVATFGDWVTRTMKGNDLFIPKYRKLLNQT